MQRLQRLIDRAAQASTESAKATSALNSYCEEVYGHAPSDVDADEIIDAVLGGCGQSPGMKAAKFHSIMKGSKS